MNNETPERPPAVRREKLRKYFGKTYNLTEEQVNVLLDSTVKSIQTTLSALHAELDGDSSLEEISRQGHNMKGLLLNMGEHQWAEIARELEKAAASGEKRDYEQMVRDIHRGVQDILSSAGE